MDQNVLLSPPIALLIVLVAACGLSAVMARLAFRGKAAAGAAKPYACGEDIPDHLIQPDYGQFFPFAFFFTILHVAALMMATVPVGVGASEILSALAIAVVYIVGAVVGLTVLYRR